MDGPDEGDDPRDALDMAYQRRLGDLADAQAALVGAVAYRHRVEQDLNVAGDDHDVSALRARLDAAMAAEGQAAARVETLRSRADAYRSERDRVWAMHDAANARDAASRALRRLTTSGNRQPTGTVDTHAPTKGIP